MSPAADDVATGRTQRPSRLAGQPIDPGVRIGHTHLRCADIDRVRAFYVDILGFEVVAEERDEPGWGTVGDTLFLAAGGYHHHLAFNTWKSAGGPPQPDGVAGLHHVGILYPTQAALADALLRLRAAGWPLRTTIDHGTHLALYLADPDGNGLELAWDRPPEQWPRNANGTPRFDVAGPVDLDALIAHAPDGAPQ